MAAEIRLIGVTLHKDLVVSEIKLIGVTLNQFSGISVKFIGPGVLLHQVWWQLR